MKTRWIVLKKWIALLSAVFLGEMLVCTACTNDSYPEKIPLEYSVCANTSLPGELQDIINDKQKKAFEITYSTDSFLYIAVGYGMMNKDNLRVVVNDFYQTEEAIYIETGLYTKEYLQDAKEKASDAGEPSLFPYIVVKCEKNNKPVVFKVSYNR